MSLIHVYLRCLDKDKKKIKNLVSVFFHAALLLYMGTSLLLAINRLSWSPSALITLQATHHHSVDELRQFEA